MMGFGETSGTFLPGRPEGLMLKRRLTSLLGLNQANFQPERI